MDSPETKSENAGSSTVRPPAVTVHSPSDGGTPLSPELPRPSAQSTVASPKRLRDFVRTMTGPESRPTMTIRQRELRHVQIGSLVIQRRTLASQHESDGELSDYQVQGLLGEGGMGQVYAANQTSFNRHVAVKILQPRLARELRDRKLFLKEACVTAELDHPNIIPVHDLGISDDGTLFYSMKMIRGKEWVEVFEQKSRAENLEILNRVCDAIAFAHSRNILHRDIKPGNVMIDAFGEVLVTDWGCAVDLSDNQEIPYGGTPAYMAPEMAKDQSERIGFATDVYLLGATLYEIVTGIPPHPGRTSTDCIMAAVENVITPYEKADNLLDIALQAMATEIEDRYQTVAEFQQAIRRYQSQLESITFAEHGYQTLEQAQAEVDFQAFSRAIFSFEDAVRLWPENRQAIQGERQARLECARAALEQKNFDLGLSVLQPESDEERKVHRELQTGQRESRKWRSYLRIARTAAMVLGIVALFASGFAFVNWQRAEDEAREAQRLAKAESVARMDAQAAAKAESEARANAQRLAGLEKQAREEAQRLAEAESAARKDAQAAAKAESDARADAERLAGLESEAREEAERLAGLEKKAREEAQRLANAESKARQNAQAAAAAERVARQQAQSLLSSALVGQYAANISFAEQAIEANRVVPAFQRLEAVREAADLSPRFKGWEMHRLYQRCHEEKPGLIPLADNQRLRLFAASADGANQVAVTHDGTVYLRRTATGQGFQRITLAGFANASADRRTVTALAVSTDGRFLAVGFRPAGTEQFIADNLQLWDLETGRNAAVIDAHPFGVQGLEFGRDCLVTIGEDRNRAGQPQWFIKRWGFADGATVGEATEPSAYYFQLGRQIDRWDISAVENALFCAVRGRDRNYDVSMISLDASSWPEAGGRPGRMTEQLQCLATATANGPFASIPEITSLVVVPAVVNGEGVRACICGLIDGSLMLVTRTESPASKDCKWEIRKLESSAHTRAVKDLRWDGEFLVSSGADRIACIWRWNGADLQLVNRLAGHQQDLIGVTTSPDRSRIVTADQQIVREWSPRGVEDEITLAESLTLDRPRTAAFARSTEGRVGLAGDSAGTTWKFFPDRQPARLTFYPAETGRHDIVAFDEERNLLATTSDKGQIVFWASESGKPAYSIDLNWQDGASSRSVILHFDKRFGRFVARESGESVVVFGRETDRTCTAQRPFDMVGYNPDIVGEKKVSIQQAILSSDGKRLATLGGGTNDRPIVELIDVDSRKVLARTERERKSWRLGSWMFDPADTGLVVAWQRVSGEDRVEHPVEIRKFQPADASQFAESAPIPVGRPRGFSADQSFELRCIGYYGPRLVAVAKQAGETSAAVLTWDISAWDPDAKPTEYPLPQIHRDSKFELSAGILTFVTSEGIPGQVDLDTGEQEILSAVAESILPDLQDNDTLRDVVRQCRPLPGGRWLVAGKGYAWVLSPHRNNWEVAFRNIPRPACHYVGLSNDGTRGLTHHADGRVRLVRSGTTGTSSPKDDMTELDGFHDLVSMSPDGKSIAIFSARSGLALVDFDESFEQQRAVPGDLQPDTGEVRGRLTALAWSPDGQMLAAAALDPAADNVDLHLWDTKSGQPAIDQPQTGLGVRDIVSLSISGAGPNNQRVLSAIDSENRLRLLATGKRPPIEAAPDAGHQMVWTVQPDLPEFDNVRSAAMNPDYRKNGYRVAIGKPNSQLEIWLADIDEEGFALQEDNPDVRIRQLFRVFDFAVDYRETDVVFTGFDASGEDLGTLTAREMKVWLTDGWDKEKPEPESLATHPVPALSGVRQDPG
jgi:serine/threonine protein kinase/WD40 repeat protein